MWINRTQRKIFHTQLMLASLAIVQSSAQAEPLEPHFAYITGYFSTPGPVYQFFSSPGDILVALKGYWENKKDVDGLAHHKAISIRPRANPILFNGNIATYEVEMQVLQNGIWVPNGYEPSVSLDLDCPLSPYKLRFLGQVGNNIKYDCYDSRPVEQPYCGTCEKKTPPGFDKPEISGFEGDPVFVATGMNQQIEIDYQSNSPSGLKFVRTYRSDRNGWANNFQVLGTDLTQAVSLPPIAGYRGIGHDTEQTPYYFRLMPSGGLNDFMIQRGGGMVVRFGTATDLSPSANVNDRVAPILDAIGTKIGYQVYNAGNEAKESYDMTGRLQTSTARNSQVQSMQYSDSTTPVGIAPVAGLLLRVADNFGYQLSFTYDAKSRMVTMTDPAGGVYGYAYDEPSSIVSTGNRSTGNLTSVTYPDGKKRVYWYNEQDKTQSTNLPSILTGITDENGVRFATFTYNSIGKALSTEHAGGQEKHNFTYYGSSTLVDYPLGGQGSYGFNTVLGAIKIASKRQPAGAGSSASSQSVFFDANGNVSRKTDFNGGVTTYSYDLSRNLETSRVEASGTPQARTVMTAWHANYRLPLSVSTPLLRTSYIYDANGNLLSQTEQATTDVNGASGFSASLSGSPRTWSYSYNSVGQILTVTGPRTDVADVTTYTYDTAGNLSTVTDPLGHVTVLSNYDAHGHVGRVTDPNGLITDYSYSPRGWLTAKTVGGDNTRYDYDNAGQLIRVTLPDNTSLAYTYDPAHRLTDIADNLGNTIHYTLDALGNRTQEQVKDQSGKLARQVTRIVDALSRVQQITGAAQ